MTPPITCTRLDAHQFLMRVQRQQEPTIDLAVCDVCSEAAHWLWEHRHPNRPMTPQRVEQLGNPMQQDAWELNGETLIISDEGRLLDGQNRCKASSDTGKTFTSVVAFGIPHQMFHTIGLVVKRSSGHILAMAGEKDYMTLAAALGLHWRYEHKAMRGHWEVLPAYQILDYLTAHPGIRASLSWGYMVRKLVPRALGTALHYLFSQRDGTLAKQYYTDLAGGEYLSRKDTLYWLREMFLLRKEAHHRLGEAAYSSTAASMILAWNALRQGKRLTRAGLTWPPPGEEDVLFPEIL